MNEQACNTEPLALASAGILVFFVILFYDNSGFRIIASTINCWLRDYL